MKALFKNWASPTPNTILWSHSSKKHHPVPSGPFDLHILIWATVTSTHPLSWENTYTFTCCRWLWLKVRTGHSQLITATLPHPFLKFQRDTGEVNQSLLSVQGFGIISPWFLQMIHFHLYSWNTSYFPPLISFICEMWMYGPVCWQFDSICLYYYCCAHLSCSIS